MTTETEPIYKPATRAEIEARDVEDIRRATETRLASPGAAPGEPKRAHVHVTDCLRGGKVSKFCTCHHCTLSVCSVCGAYEGGLTSECPGERVDYDTTLAVYKTDLDYTTARGWHLSGERTGYQPPLFRAAEKLCAEALAGTPTPTVPIADVAHVVRNALVPARNYLEQPAYMPGSRVARAIECIDAVLAYVDGLVKQSEGN